MDSEDVNILTSLKDRARAFLFGRQRDYQLVFKNGKAAESVLKDLAKFCRANESTFHDDQRLHAVLEGRREVWLRIQRHLNMTPEELWEKYGDKRV